MSLTSSAFERGLNQAESHFPRISEPVIASGICKFFVTQTCKAWLVEMVRRAAFSFGHQELGITDPLGAVQLALDKDERRHGDMYSGSVPVA